MTVIDPNRPVRSTRRHVRVRCLLRRGGSEAMGSSTNVSITGLHVRVPASEKLSMEPNDLVEVRLFLLDEAEPLQASAQVVWTDPNELDSGGQVSTGFGLRFINPSPKSVERLERFIATFRYSVLVVDDEAHNLEVMRRILRGEYNFIGCTSAAEAIEVLSREDIAVLITDERMPGMSGLEFLRHVSERMPHSHLVRILVSAFPAGEAVIEFVNVGKIFHFLAKPISPEKLLPVVRRAIEAYAMSMENERLNAALERANRRLEQENAYLRRRVDGLHGFGGIVGMSLRLRESLAQLDRIRNADVTVHISGETGTGKELVARALHFGGPRKDQPFVAHNCAGMTESLQHSTLFGHKKGAFTGADRDYPGVFPQAHGGTLFLDEIADLSLPVQGSLLRAVQEGEILPLGGREPVKVDVRLVSATHKDLRREVREGRFREDLFFRLVVIEVELPPLRERAGDVTLLAQHFLNLLCERHGKALLGFTPAAIEVLERYQWPGNVRELENEIERAVVLSEPNTKITPAHFSPHLVSSQPAAAPASMDTSGQFVIAPGRPFDEAVTELERLMILRALEQADQSMTEAARLLGIERSRLGKMCKRLGVTR